MPCSCIQHADHQQVQTHDSNIMSPEVISENQHMNHSVTLPKPVPIFVHRGLVKEGQIRVKDALLMYTAR